MGVYLCVYVYINNDKNLKIFTGLQQKKKNEKKKLSKKKRMRKKTQ